MGSGATPFPSLSSPFINPPYKHSYRHPYRCGLIINVPLNSHKYMVRFNGHDSFIFQLQMYVSRLCTIVPWILRYRLLYRIMPFDRSHRLCPLLANVPAAFYMESVLSALFFTSSVGLIALPSNTTLILLFLIGF